MTLVAEIRGIDDEFEVEPLARLLVTGDGRIDVLELSPHGAELAGDLLGETLVDPFGRTVTRDSGADFIRTLRWLRSSDTVWITPLVDLPPDQARDPAAEVPVEAEPLVIGTVPYPEPPPELAAKPVVELRGPDETDYAREKVTARLVAGRAGAVRVEAPDPSVAAEIEARLAAAGWPPVDELDEAALPAATYAVPLDLDQPGDRAWRDGLVGTRRLAVAAGDRAAVARLDLEFTTLLPRIWLSRCPFTGHVLRMGFDGWGFDSPFWDPAAPVRPADDLPPTFLGLSGTVVEEPGAGERITPEALGPGRPPVFAELLAEPGVRAVLSAVRVGRLRCDIVAYFSREGAGAPSPFREWGTRLARVRDGGEQHWVPRPDDPPPATELSGLLRSGDLLWIEPFDSRAELRSGTEDCPWTVS